MGQVKDRRSVKRHPLLIYHRVGDRLRTVPFLLAGLSLILYGLGWLSTQDFMQAADTSLLQLFWKNQLYIFIILFVSAAVYVYGLFVGKMSTVEAKPKSLQIQAGLLRINISYRRISQIRLSQVDLQYPADSLRGADIEMLDPLLHFSCTLVDLKTWPSPGQGWLRRLWNKYMFSRDTGGLMLVVPDAMILNQQIDSHMTLLQSKSSKSQYLDPLSRMGQQQNKTGRR